MQFFGSAAVRHATAPGILIAILILTLTSPAWATLGDNEQSVEIDRVSMKGSLRVIAAQGYVIHQIQAPAGNVIREFVSPGGSVFAVAWEGPGGIDLRQLLGPYFEEFKQTMAQSQHTGRGPVSLETPGLVFQQGGHMRAFDGRAFVPQLLPANVDISDIR